MANTKKEFDPQWKTKKELLMNRSIELEGKGQKELAKLLDYLLDCLAKIESMVKHHHDLLKSNLIKTWLDDVKKLLDDSVELPNIEKRVQDLVDNGADVYTCSLYATAEYADGIAEEELISDCTTSIVSQEIDVENDCFSYIIDITKKVNKVEGNGRDCSALRLMADCAEQYVECWRSENLKLKLEMPRASVAAQELAKVLEAAYDQVNLASVESNFSDLVVEFKRHAQKMNDLLKGLIPSNNTAGLDLILRLQRKVDTDCRYLGNTLEGAPELKSSGFHEELSKKGIENLTEASASINDATKNVCALFGGETPDATVTLEPMLSQSSPLQIQKKAEYLEFVSRPGIRVLCVCGMGGLGKTTLLRALYDEFPKRDKQAKAFVEVGRDPTNVMKIQKKILSQLKGKEEKFIDTEQGRNGLSDCIKGFKAGGTSLCLCIDNVWKVNDLRNLLPEDLHLHLPQCSCLMLSTRDEVVAYKFRDMCCSNNANPNAYYELFRPEFMGDKEAEELFVRCAEIQDKEKERDLLNAIVPLCGGLPLALKTYGDYFKPPEKRKEDIWETVKQRILAAGDDEVLKSLEPSIDVQTPQVQEAFVDAALFWRRKPLLTARCALYDDGDDILEVLLQGSILYSHQEYWYTEPILECHDFFIAIAEKRATLYKWKYCVSVRYA